MPIAVTCSSCGRRHQAPDKLAGTTAKCPCGAALAVPRPAPVVDPHAPTTVMCRCQKCKETLVLPIQMAGTQANCPACNGLMVVPYPEGMAKPNSLLDELTEKDWDKVLNPHSGKSVEKNIHADQLAQFAKALTSEGADEFDGLPRSVYNLLCFPAGITLFLIFVSIISMVVVEDMRDQVKDMLAMVITIYVIVGLGCLVPLVAGAMIKKGRKGGIVMGYIGAVFNFLFTPLGFITAIFLIIKLSSPKLKAYVERTAAKQARRAAG